MQRDAGLQKVPKLTRNDFDILRELQGNAWLSNEVIGERVKKSASVVSRRVGELQKAGVITGVHAAIDAQKVGLVTTVFTLVLLKSHGDGLTDNFEREVAALPNVVEVARIGGSWDFLLKFAVRDTPQYDLLHNKLLALPMVSRVRGMHVIGKPQARPLPLE